MIGSVPLSRWEANMGAPGHAVIVHYALDGGDTDPRLNATQFTRCNGG
jgi:hypothetical protein